MSADTLVVFDYLAATGLYGFFLIHALVFPVFPQAERVGVDFFVQRVKFWLYLRYMTVNRLLTFNGGAS